jgi:Fe-S oxidoreductase
MEASFPPEVQETFTNLENQANPWGFGADSRADWCKGMDVPLMSDNPEADLLWFVGCAGSFDDRGRRFPRPWRGCLQRAGVNFAILGTGGGMQWGHGPTGRQRVPGPDADPAERRDAQRI